MTMPTQGSLQNMKAGSDQDDEGTGGLLKVDTNDADEDADRRMKLIAREDRPFDELRASLDRLTVEQQRALELAQLEEEKKDKIGDTFSPTKSRPEGRRKEGSIIAKARRSYINDTNKNYRATNDASHAAAPKPLAHHWNPSSSKNSPGPLSPGPTAKVDTSKWEHNHSRKKFIPPKGRNLASVFTERLKAQPQNKKSGVAAPSISPAEKFGALNESESPMLAMPQRQQSVDVFETLQMEGDASQASPHHQDQNARTNLQGNDSPKETIDGSFDAESEHSENSESDLSMPTYYDYNTPLKPTTEPLAQASPTTEATEVTEYESEELNDMKEKKRERLPEVFEHHVVETSGVKEFIVDRVPEKKRWSSQNRENFPVWPPIIKVLTWERKNVSGISVGSGFTFDDSLTDSQATASSLGGVQRFENNGSLPRRPLENRTSYRIRYSGPTSLRPDKSTSLPPVPQRDSRFETTKCVTDGLPSMPNRVLDSAPTAPSRRSADDSTDDDDASLGLGEAEQKPPDVWITPLEGTSISNAMWKVKRVWEVEEEDEKEREHSVHNSQLLSKIKTLVGARIDAESVAQSEQEASIPASPWRIQTFLEKRGRLENVEDEQILKGEELEKQIDNMARDGLKEIEDNNVAMAEALKRQKELEDDMLVTDDELDATSEDDIASLEPAACQKMRETADSNVIDPIAEQISLTEVATVVDEMPPLIPAIAADIQGEGNELKELDKSLSTLAITPEDVSPTPESSTDQENATEALPLPESSPDEQEYPVDVVSIPEAPPPKHENAVDMPPASPQRTNEKVAKDGKSPKRNRSPRRGKSPKGGKSPTQGKSPRRGKKSIEPEGATVPDGTRPVVAEVSPRGKSPRRGKVPGVKSLSPRHGKSPRSGRGEDPPESETKDKRRKKRPTDPMSPKGKPRKNKSVSSESTPKKNRSASSHSTPVTPISNGTDSTGTTSIPSLQQLTPEAVILPNTEDSDLSASGDDQADVAPESSRQSSPSVNVKGKKKKVIISAASMVHDSDSESSETLDEDTPASPKRTKSVVAEARRNGSAPWWKKDEPGDQSRSSRKLPSDMKSPLLQKKGSVFKAEPKKPQ